MGSKFLKRIAHLKEHSRAEDIERIGFFKVFFLSFIALLIFGMIFSDTPEVNLEELQADEELEEEEYYEPSWYALAIYRNETRGTWMKYTVIGFLFSGIYQGIGESLIDFASSFDENIDEDSDSLFDPSSWIASIAQGSTSSFLRVMFAVMTFWPFWLLALWAAYTLVKKGLAQKVSTSVLGYCNLEGRPFYSGIYGPLKPNHSISGIDYSCPNLVCPPQEKDVVAMSHSLVSILKKYRAFNQTNFELVKIILAHKDYPAEVLEERSAEEDDTEELSSFVTNEEGTLEQSAKEGLIAVLEAHLALLKLHKSSKSLAKKGESKGSDEKKNSKHKMISFKQASEKVATLCENLSPLGQILIKSLIPSRGKALAFVPPTLVATAYLATEAGKSLVYDRIDDRFTRISVFPHLQARAVLQSLQSYHANYKGDGRLIARQAIICSRRHGDFGRAFLPVNMPIQSRAIRDWLEILYTPKLKRLEHGKLIELDAHIEELHIHLKDNLDKKLHDEFDPEVDNSNSYAFWKGLSFKSVVLFPLSSLLDITFANIEKARLKRIVELMDETRELQGGLSISARLPGFKRQAMEAAKCKSQIGSILSEVRAQKGGERLVEKWMILRRMLTRYNWLSTRIGDDAVPPDGLVEAILVDRTKQEAPDVIGLDAVVPLRQRRFKELLGENWEREFYQTNIHPRDVHIFVDSSEFKRELAKMMNQAQNGTLATGPVKRAS